MLYEVITVTTTTYYYLSEPLPTNKIFSEPKNELEATINKASIFYLRNNPEIDNYFERQLYDFDGDGFPEILEMYNREIPNECYLSCQSSISSLRDKEINHIGYLNVITSYSIHYTKLYDLLYISRISGNPSPSKS